MADKNWGFKIYCECGVKYYSLNKKDKIFCPVCKQEHIPEDLNLRQAPIQQVKSEPIKKIEDLEYADDASDETDDIISLDDQKDIEDSGDDSKQD